MADVFQRVFSNAPWETKVGYCRAVKAGNQIFITGTAPVNNDGSKFNSSKPYDQACRCFELISLTLRKFDASLINVVRTRMFVTDIGQWESFGRAHQEYFGDHPPATTMVEVNSLIDPSMMIEVEADAVLLNRECR